MIIAIIFFSDLKNCDSILITTIGYFIYRIILTNFVCLGVLKPVHVMFLV